MNKPGKQQQTSAAKPASNLSDPEPGRDDGRDLERHGIPPEMVKAERGAEDTEAKGHPTSDREDMEATAAKQKAASRK